SLTCPGKPDGRVCIYIRKSVAPGDPTAVTSESLHVMFPDLSTFDANPPLDAPSTPCGPGEPPVRLTPLLISGGTTVGSTLTVSNGPGTWGGDMPQTYEVRWYRVSGGDLDLVGAGDSYTVQPADAGKEIHAVVVATNPEKDKTTQESSGIVVTAPSGGGTG